MSNQFMGAAADYTYYDMSLYGNRSCGFPPDDSFHIFRSATDGSYPWPGMIFGLTILATNAWCTDQVSMGRCADHVNTNRCTDQVHKPGERKQVHWPGDRSGRQQLFHSKCAFIMDIYVICMQCVNASF